MREHHLTPQERLDLAARFRGERAALEYPMGPPDKDGNPTPVRLYGWVADVPLPAVLQYMGSQGLFARNVGAVALDDMRVMAYSLPADYWLRESLMHDYEQAQEGRFDAEEIDLARGKSKTVSFEQQKKLGLSDSRMVRAGWRKAADHWER